MSSLLFQRLCVFFKISVALSSSPCTTAKPQQEEESGYLSSCTKTLNYKKWVLLTWELTLGILPEKVIQPGWDHSLLWLGFQEKTTDSFSFEETKVLDLEKYIFLQLNRAHIPQGGCTFSCAIFFNISYLLYITLSWWSLILGAQGGALEFPFSHQCTKYNLLNTEILK